MKKVLMMILFGGMGYGVYEMVVLLRVGYVMEAELDYEEKNRELGRWQIRCGKLQSRSFLCCGSGMI